MLFNIHNKVSLLFFHIPINNVLKKLLLKKKKKKTHTRIDIGDQLLFKSFPKINQQVKQLVSSKE